MNINLHIERIILDGWQLNEHERGRLQQTLMDSLTTILRDGSLSPALLNSTHLSSLSGNTRNLSGSNDSVALGDQLAQGLGNALMTQTQFHERGNEQ